MRPYQKTRERHVQASNVSMKWRHKYESADGFEVDVPGTEGCDGALQQFEA